MAAFFAYSQLTDDLCLCFRCIDAINSFRCLCLPGYTDEHCATEINECESNPCHNGGTCIDLYDGFYCRCPSTFQVILIIMLLLM